MDENLAHYALQQSKADYAEVRMEELHGLQAVVKNGNLDIYQLFSQYGLSVRALIDGGLGFASTNRLDKESINHVVEKAQKLARTSATRNTEKIGLSDEEMHTASYEIPQKKNLEDVDRSQELLNLNNHLEHEEGLVFQLYQYTDEDHTKYFVNTEGAEIRSRIPRVSLLAILTVIESNDSEQCQLQYGGVGGWETFQEFNLYEKLPKEVRVLYRILKEGVKAPSDSVSVIVGPEVAGITAHESCGHPLEADRILGREAAQAGESFVNPTMVGTTIGSELVNIAEDPTIEGSYGYYLYDDEGVKARKRMLIKEGKINEFLSNRETGYALKGKSNGAARAMAFDREPIVRMANTYFCAGDYTKEELIEETKKGVLMESFTEWNIDDTRFNQRYIGREAYVIENGEVGPPVVRPVLEVTTTGFYSSVDAVADEIVLYAGTCGKGDPVQGAPTCMGGPYMRLKDIRLGGVHG
ncbi:MAG: TldD/PmbA family protein [Theionarchaea archaeon]|nr:TldD/PmbA family protein [Theionarchaea archaeon]MBU6999674.1 TldD/PmbA family protein [Theionarchaea archaeon]MBU7022086.1 TldD/PmbA family protein [Theionarchaea archaeon]MBU7035941.1 TldD/PmbA family protein [Theionarchaea archaeon]MBU7040444.1 TldD/PmbA family protein [Theionarchaea archaeon]